MFVSQELPGPRRLRNHYSLPYIQPYCTQTLYTYCTLIMIYIHAIILPKPYFNVSLSVNFVYVCN